MKHVRLTALSVCVLVLTLSTSADAALLESNLVPGSGDNMLTIDTDTGLEWLDLTVTAGKSVNQVLGGYGGYATDQGFRYATGSEVRGLLTSAGTGERPSGSTNAADSAAMRQLLGLIGVTYVNNLPSSGDYYGQQSAYGITGDTYKPSSDSPLSYQYSLFSATNGWMIATVYDGTIYPDSSGGPMGSFLVRQTSPVPLPPSLMLLGAGLAVLIGLGNRLKATAEESIQRWS